MLSRHVHDTSRSPCLLQAWPILEGQTSPTPLLQDVIDLMSEIATDAVLEGGGGAADFRTSGGGRGKAVSRPGDVTSHPRRA
jgi:hypothetical protein